MLDLLRRHGYDCQAEAASAKHAACTCPGAAAVRARVATLVDANVLPLSIGGDHFISFPILQALAPAPDTGWLHAGPVGAGHFVKMVHNGIEYGMMQALAEGFSLMAAKKAFSLDLAAVGELWRHGSVVRSWLLDLTAQALHQDASLAGIKPHVADSGEGRWTAREAVDLRLKPLLED